MMEVFLQPERTLRQSRFGYRWFRRLLMAGLALIATVSSAWACSCLPDGIPQRSFKAASIIFRGTLVGTEYRVPSYCDLHSYGDCRPYLAGNFSVDDALKGTPARLRSVRLYDGNRCGPPVPSVGETSWIAAIGDEERGYSLSACMWFDPPREGDDGPLAETIAEYQVRLESLNTAVEQAPSDPDALMALATFYVETNGRLEAIRTLDQLLTIGPLHREATLMKARHLLHQADVLDALVPYLAAHPDDHEALHRRVLALVRLDRVSDVPVGWRDFTELHGVNFDFSNAKLNDASFRGNQMYRTSFAEAELQRADFSDVKVWGSSFAGADLTGAVMVKATIGQADFRGAVLSGADLTGANLAGANLTGAVYDEGTVWPAGFNLVAAGAMKQP
jgi:hypothetical protein